MPKYQLLEQNQTLNKGNFKDILRTLYQKAIRVPINNQGEVKQVFDEMDISGYEDKLNYFINATKRYLTQEQAQTLANFQGINQNTFRENLLQHWRNILTTYRIDYTEEVQNLARFLDDHEHNKNTSLEALKARILPLIREEERYRITNNVIDILNPNTIKGHFEDYLNYLDTNLSDEQLREIGEEVNNHKTKYDYTLDDTLSRSIYDNETQEVINTLKETKTLNNKTLTDNEIAEYENALNYANKLFGEPLFDVGSFIVEKGHLDSALAHDYEKNADERLEAMGFDPTAITKKQDAEIGLHTAVAANKKYAFEHIRNNMEFEFFDDEKAHIKEIILKMQQLGFDQGRSTGEQLTKIYGLQKLFDAGVKYKEAITSNNPEEKLKAAIYAKEVLEEDRKVKEVLALIKKYMPLDPNDVYAIPGNVDSVRTGGIPTEYRLDFGAISQLAAFNNIVNLIKENNWKVDDFLKKPMDHMRKLFDTKANDMLNPKIAFKDLTGVDLLVSMTRSDVNDKINALTFSTGRALEGLSCTSKNKDNIANNYVKNRFFTDKIANSYMTMSTNRYRMASSPNINLTIINPNLKFDDLGINYYDAKTGTIVKQKESFDEISYLKKRTESLEDFKNRLDETMLKYMKAEIELAAETQKPNVLLLNSKQYVDEAQKAALKYLLVRKDEKNTPAYQAIESFVRNKKAYVNNLVNSIPENNKYAEYQIVKDVIDQPLNINGFNYRPASVGNENNYVDALDGFDNFIRTNKARVKTQAAEFIKDDKTSINAVKKAYNDYAQAKRLYDSEVRKLYGANYYGAINNLANDKIKNAFIKQNNLLRDLEALKKENLELVIENVKDATIPESYLVDRQIAFKNNKFDDIPLFRKDKQFTMDEYLRFNPNNNPDLSNEEAFNNYKKEIEKMENDFFVRRYLEKKHLTDKKEEVIDVKKYEIEEKEINKDVIQARILGVKEREVQEKEYGINEKFDEVSYINNHSRLPKDFKERIDKLIIGELKKYNVAKDVNELTPLKDIIDVAQKTVLEYTMLVPNYDANNVEIKELNSFIVDGNSYINKLIEKENALIDARNAQKLEDAQREVINQKQNAAFINFNELLEKNLPMANELGLKDYEINNYASIKDDFEKYYQTQIKNNTLPAQALAAERQMNISLKEKLDQIDELNLENDNAKKELDDLIDLAKFRVNKLYLDGLVTSDYVKNRLERLDNHDLKLPSIYEIDDMPKMDDYIRKVHPNEFNHLSKDDKKVIYETYKRTCEQQRKDEILNKFLVEKGIADKHENNALAYQKYLDDLTQKFNQEHQVQQNQAPQNQVQKEEHKIEEYDHHSIIDEKDEIIIDNDNDNIIDNKVEDEKEEDFRDLIKDRLNETIIDEEFEDLDDDSIIIEDLDKNRDK